MRSAAPGGGTFDGDDTISSLGLMRQSAAYWPGGGEQQMLALEGGVGIVQRGRVGFHVRTKKADVAHPTQDQPLLGNRTPLFGMWREEVWHLGCTGSWRDWGSVIHSLV